ncbi:hypothetical protein PRIC2_000855 [Phytophthora ramorum]|uniref:EGF-like domain-containing protein n=1 Tax=Phytophthora ramorum TaxID=164328 RepID=H3GFG7_PHYRM
MGGRRKMLLASGLVLLVAALLSVPTSAECPNGCSGNGACMAKDMCNCYKNYQGNDCLDRTCQFGYAHADTPKGDINMDQSRVTPSWILTDSQQDPAGTYEYFNPDAATSEAHFYMECANKGLCDRTLGVCTCFDGYEGGACQRSACPNKCTGHGTCESLRELGLKTPGTLFGNPQNVDQITYDLWDSRVSYGCRCDPGYHGPDCSLRSCKVGVDPMFLAVGAATFKTFALHVYTTGTWTADSASGPPENFVRLRLFDYHGESYITNAIQILDDTAGTSTKIANAAAVAAAITSVPNQTFRYVLCEWIAQTDGDLDGYLTTRTGSKGLSVVCQFIQNPGRLRTPEVASFGFKNVVDPLTKFSTVYTMEDGLDNEWFTENTRITYMSIDNTFLVITVTNPDAPVVFVADTAATLFRIGSRLLVGKQTAFDTITLTYPTKHTLSKTNTRFNVAAASGFAIAELVCTAVTLGSKTITVTTNPAFTAGQLVFFENQFYKPQSVVDTSITSTPGPWAITLDRPFPGNTLNGGDNTILKVYKVTPPADAFQYKYVSQCSGRGLCTTETGVCACFKGYTNDNCDTQNILAL